MRKKNWIYLVAIVILAAASFIVLTSSSSGVKAKESPTCCKKKAKECSIEPQKPGAGDMIMENMSRQFINITSF